VLAVLLLEVLIAWSYAQYVSPVYAYSGFRYRPAGLVHIAVSILIGAIPVLWLPLRPRTPGHVLLWLIQIFVVCSSCALGPLVPYRGIWETVGWSLWNTACMAAVSVYLILPRLDLPRTRASARSARRAFFTVVGIVIVLLVVEFGIPRPDFGLGTMGDRRLEFRGSLATGGVVLGYLVGWIQSLLAPIALVSGLLRRRPAGVVLGGSALLWLYLIQGTRTSLVAVPFALVLWFALSRRATAAQYVWGSISLLVVSLGMYLLTGWTMILGSIVQRLYMVPGVLGMFYFDFFTGHPPGLYRDSFAGALSASPYPLEVPRLIGAVYLGSSDTNANVHFFADAYAQLWLAGLLLPVLVAMVLWLLDSAAKELHQPAVLGSLSLMALLLVNTGASNWLATNGMVVGLVVYWLAGPALFPPSPDGTGRRRPKASPTRRPWPSRAVP
jgi:hypothetical protein